MDLYLPCDFGKKRIPFTMLLVLPEQGVQNFGYDWRCLTNRYTVTLNGMMDRLKR